MSRAHADHRAPFARRVRERALLALLAGIVGGALAATSPGVLADEGEEPGAEDAEPADVSRSGYYTAPLPTVLPPFFTDEVPPGAFCIVAPELCTEDAQQVTGPVEGAIGTVQEETPPEPVQLVVPGSLPVTLLAGHPRHVSFLEFEVPVPPATDMDVHVTEFDLVLHEEIVPVGFTSPGFRALVRAFVAQIADDPSPDPFLTELENIATNEEPLLEAGITGVEVCPVIDDWEDGENQDARELPEVDVVFCATGEHDEDTGTWTFDLTFAAQAWVDGLLEHNGVAIRPIMPENVDYGDPEPTASFTMAFAGPEADEEERPAVRAAFEEVEPFEPFEPADAAFDDTPEPAPDPAPAPGPQAATGPAVTADPQPAGPEPAPVEEPAAAPEEPTPEPAPEEPADAPADPSIPLHWWLLLPLGATATALFTRALVATPEPEALASGGALSNLMDQ